MRITVKPELGSKQKSDGTFPVLIRITQNRKHKRLSIGYSVPKKDFNSGRLKNLKPPSFEKANWILRSNPRHKIINNAIKAKIIEISNLHNELKDKATSNNIVKHLKGEASDSFIKFYSDHLERVYKHKDYNTLRAQRAELNKLKGYLNGKDLKFDELDGKFLSDYDIYLRTVKKNNQTTIHKAFVKIRTIVNAAVHEGVISIEKNPFLGRRLKSSKPEKVRLTPNEIELIEALELPENSLMNHSRNAFIFSYYCAGIRVADVLTLKWDNVNDNRLIYRMDKNDKFGSIKVPKKGLDILAVYSPLKAESIYIFPFFNNDIDYSEEAFLKKQIQSKTAQINNNLKKIAKKAGIPKNISMHVARHSFADYARTKTSDVYSVSKLLRHSKISTTESYLASFDDSSMDQAMDSIFDD